MASDGIRTRADRWRTRGWIGGTGLVRAALAGMIGLTLALAGQAPVCAQATRTWVSGVGDDVNPCSRTAPCKTFAGAISKTAANGEINIMDPGGYGTVTITKSISIIAEGFTGGILAAGTNGINVNDSATATPNTIVVVLRGLDIQGAGTGLVGINFTAGKSLHVENTTINGFNAGSGRGINVALPTNGELFVSNSDIHNNLEAGIRVSTTSGLIKSAIDNTRLGNNGIGLWAHNNSRVTIRDSEVSGNTNAGLQALADAGGATAELNVESTTTTANGIGINSGNGSQQAIVRIASTMVYGNATGLSIASGSQVLSFGNNMIFGNTNPGPNPGSIPLQ